MAYVADGGDEWVADEDDAPMHEQMGDPTNDTKAAVAPVNITMRDHSRTHAASMRRHTIPDVPAADLRRADTSMSGLIAVAPMHPNGQYMYPGRGNPASPDVGFTTSACSTSG